jgi:hypothetical protein
MIPIAPLRATWVPPQADRSNPSTSINRSVPPRAGSLRSGSAAASSDDTKRIVTGRSSHTDAVGFRFGGGDLGRTTARAPGRSWKRAAPR